MNGRVLALTALIGLLGLAALAYVMLNFLAAPRFQVSNATQHPVRVTAYWRDQQRDLGVLSAGEQRLFTVHDEAALYFRARYPDGVQRVSDEIYFSSGTRVRATVTAAGIAVDYVGAAAGERAH